MGPAPLEFWSLAVSDLVLPDSREWNVDTIQLVLPFEEHKIRSIKPSVSGAPDKLSWLGASLGNYSTQSGYAAAISKRSDVMDIAQEHLNFNWKKEIWSLKTSLKTKLFAWKIIHGAIPTGEALRATAAWDTIKLCCNQIRWCLEWKLKYCRSRLDSGFSEQSFIVLGLGAPCKTLLAAEALALREATWKCGELSLARIKCESDCAYLVKAINAKIPSVPSLVSMGSWLIFKI